MKITDIFMKSIKTKLIISACAMILVAILIVAIPMVESHSHEVETNIERLATAQISTAKEIISAFFGKSTRMVKDIVYHLENSELNLEKLQKDFQTLIDDEPNIMALYYADEVQMKDGGKFYYSGGWTPDSDYDKYTRKWFTAGRDSSCIVFTDPYIDAATNSLVSSICHKITHKDGSFAGTAGIDVNLKELNIIVDNIRLTKNGHSYIIDKNGTYLTNESFSKILKDNFFEDYPELKECKHELGKEIHVEARTKSNYYLAGQVINEEKGWILVSIGRSREIYTDLLSSIRLIIFCGIIALGVSVFVAILISSTIVKPISNVNDAIKEIAEGHADLTRRLTTKSKDEVGELVDGFNMFMKKMHVIIAGVKDSKNALANVKNELQHSIDNTASAITQILSNVESVGGQIRHQSEAVSQTSSAVTEIAENINSLERMIETQSSGVAEASAAVEQMIGNISSVNNSVEKMAASFGNLEKGAKEGIQKQQRVSEHVVEIEAQSKALQDANVAINKVASQTNLLAMNAAIEAAHAGEAGKGFSVVADEIRKLSETSAAESKKISEELRKISDSISAVVIAAHESSHSFAEVGEKISQTDELVNHIKSAMQEQQEGSKQILDALKMMNDSTIEVKNSSHEMALGNQSILREIQTLEDATMLIKGGMTEMTSGASEMNRTSATLTDISVKVRESINKIGSQIDQFKV